jgi:hypothetical protein
VLCVIGGLARGYADRRARHLRPPRMPSRLLARFRASARSWRAAVAMRDEVQGDVDDHVFLSPDEPAIANLDEQVA